jgi:8-oxo-dGTP pyrophosphatase MutT (NUDIX family)
MNVLRRALYLAARGYWHVARPLTLGVRVILVREERVLLVRHSYQRHWYVPGGLVEHGETLAEAARREAREEVGATLGELTLLGIYSSFAEGKSDHITVFACTDFSLVETSNPEIERWAFFRVDELPEDTSPGTRRRIAAYLADDRVPGYGAW